MGEMGNREGEKSEVREKRKKWFFFHKFRPLGRGVWVNTKALSKLVQCKTQSAAKVIKEFRGP